MKNKRGNKIRLLSILFSLVVIASIIMLGPAKAVSLGLTDLSDDNPYEGSTVTFTAYVDIESGERVPVDNLTLTIGSDSCTFYPNGTEISGDLCDDITISKLTQEGWGYGYSWGYGTTDDTPANYTFGYGYGYGYEDANYELSYEIEWNTPSVSSNTYYDVTLEANTEDHTYSKTYDNYILVRNSGGGGGGAAGDTTAEETGEEETEEAEVVAEETDSVNAQAGTETTVLVENNQIAITGIQFTAAEDLTNEQITTRTLDAQPSGTADLSIATSGEVYQYIEIEHSFSDSAIESPILSFRVPKSWLNRNKIQSNEISLFRYDGNWDRISTSVVNEDADYVYYSANVPGLSYYSIAQYIKPIKTEPTTPITGEVIEEGEEIEPGKGITGKAVEEMERAPLAGTIILIVAIIACILIILALIKRKRKY